MSKVIHWAFWRREISSEDKCSKFLKHDFVGKAWENTSSWTLCCCISGNTLYMADVMHIKKLHLVSCPDNWLCSPLFLFKTGCSMQLLKKLCTHTSAHRLFITPQIFQNKSCCLGFKLFFCLLQHENHSTLGSAAFCQNMIQKFNKSISGFFFSCCTLSPSFRFSAFLALVYIVLIAGKLSISNTAGIFLSKSDYSWSRTCLCHSYCFMVWFGHILGIGTRSLIETSCGPSARASWEPREKVSWSLDKDTWPAATCCPLCTHRCECWLLHLPVLYQSPSPTMSAALGSTLVLLSYLLLRH